jgi:hypothetical protein
MTHRSLHLQQVESIERSASSPFCYVVCEAPSGGSLEVRLPVAEARKLYALLRREFEAEKTA